MHHMLYAILHDTHRTRFDVSSMRAQRWASVSWTRNLGLLLGLERRVAYRSLDTMVEGYYYGRYDY